MQVFVYLSCATSTAVLQDLGGSNKLKISFVLGNISEKIKNWEGFPQTSQSHKTLYDTIAQNQESNAILRQKNNLKLYYENNLQKTKSKP